GQQAHQGAGSIGNPDGPAYNPLTTLRGGRGGRGGPGRGARPSTAGRAGEGESGAAIEKRPGLFDAAFQGGYTLSFWVADAATGEGHEFWHNTKDDQSFTAINTIEWAGTD